MYVKQDGKINKVDTILCELVGRSQMFFYIMVINLENISGIFLKWLNDAACPVSDELATLQKHSIQCIEFCHFLSCDHHHRRRLYLLL